MLSMVALLFRLSNTIFRLLLRDKEVRVEAWLIYSKTITLHALRYYSTI
jgi:hypothetical protein